MTSSTPAPIRIDVAGSFARSVFTERHPKLVERLLDALPFGPQERTAIERLLTESITTAIALLPESARGHDRWQRWDAGLYGTPWSQAPFLVDDSAVVWSVLDSAQDSVVALIADNAAGELVPDLVPVDHLLATGLAWQVVVWGKPAPYYVSDATMADVVTTIGFLRAAPHAEAAALGRRLQQLASTGRLVVRTHEFFCAPLPFAQLPTDLGADLAAATITVLEGDLNYRRLVGDLHWDPATPFDHATAHFPSPLIALRTLKSDVVVGLTDRQAATLDADDPGWRTSGEHALVQADVAPRTG